MSTDRIDCSRSQLGRVGDQSEVNRSDEHHLELFERREDASKAFKPAKETSDFIGRCLICAFCMGFFLGCLASLVQLTRK